MSVVESQAVKSKLIKNVAKKSTTKAPQFWPHNKNKDCALMEDDKVEDFDNNIDSPSTVYQETLNNLKALNEEKGTSEGKPANGHDDTTNMDTDSEPIILCSESSQSMIDSGSGSQESSQSQTTADELIEPANNGLMEVEDVSHPTEDSSSTHISTDDEDILLLLSDAESAMSQDNSEPSVPNKDNKQQTADSTHPLAIGMKVRNSVRDIMSKLVQDGSPEVNKILSKPKSDNNSSIDPPIKTIKPVTYKSENKSTSTKIVKENLFEIMSAESESVDLTSSRKSNMLCGDDVTSSSGSTSGPLPVFSTSKTSAELNTQDDTVSSKSPESEQPVSNSGDTKPSSESVDNEPMITNISHNDPSESKLDNQSDSISGETNEPDSPQNDTNSDTPSPPSTSITPQTPSSEANISLSPKPVVSTGSLHTSKPYVITSQTPQSVASTSDRLQSKASIAETDMCTSDSEDMNDVTLSESPSTLKCSDEIVPQTKNNKSKISGVAEKLFDSSPKSQTPLKPDINPFQFDVQSDDDNSNSNMFGKIDIDQICDNLLIDDNKTDVSEDSCKTGADNSEETKADKSEKSKPAVQSNDETKNSVEVHKEATTMENSQNVVEKENFEKTEVTLQNEIEIEKADVKKENSAENELKDEEMKKETKDEMKEETKDEMKEETKDEMNEETKDEMKEETKDEMKEETKDEMKEETKDEMKEEKEELKSKNESDVKPDTKMICEDEIEIKNDVHNNKLDIKDVDLKLKPEELENVEKMDVDDDNSSHSNVSAKCEKTASSSNSVKSGGKDTVVKDRKRSVSATSDCQAPPKRSRLDIMIGKLGDQIGIAPENVPDAIDCDTVSESEEESRQGSDEVKSDDDDTKSADSATEDEDAKTIYEKLDGKTAVDIENKSKADKISDENSSEKSIEKPIDIVDEAKDDVKADGVESSETMKTDDKISEDVQISEDVINKPTDTIDDGDDDVELIETVDPPSKFISYDKETDLDKAVRHHVLQLIKSYKDETVKSMQKKINELTAGNEKWKNTAKDLQKQVLELTIVKQRLDKRKAATAALKVINSRTIGCQVDSNRIQSGTDIFSLQKSPIKSSSLPTTQYTSYTPIQTTPGQTMVSMIKRPSPTGMVGQQVNVNNMSQLLSATAVSRNSTNISNSNARPGLTSVRNLLETTGYTARSASSQTNLNNTTTVTTANKNSNRSTSGNSVKVIDLTADEDNKKLTSTMVKSQMAMVPVAAPVQTSQTQILRPIGPGALPPGASILLSGPSGTQIVNQSTFNRMAGNLQVVTVSAGNTQIRPGSLLTVVPTTTGTNLRPKTVTMAPIPSAGVVNKPLTIDASNFTTSVRTPVYTPAAAQPTVKSLIQNVVKHPAPLPPQPVNKTPNGGVKGLVPPKPDLKISRVSQGIVLSWTITQNLSLYSEIASYQLFAYQEGTTPPNSNLWKKVGDVKALPLPMACTLTQFQEGNKYHFAVRALDIYQRISDFSDPSSIHLFPKS